jgi:hypothetical protein
VSFRYESSKPRALLEHVLVRFGTNDYKRLYSPKEMGAVYSRSKIVFTKSINGDVNMRFFEALTSGALLVTDRIGSGLSALTTEGVHNVGYDSAEEAEHQIAYFLAHDEERKATAKAGQMLVLERHTYAQRLQTILETVDRNPYARSLARGADRRVEVAWRSECHRMQGVRFGTAVAILAEGGWSGRSLANTAVAATRGIIRPLRQRLTRK